MKNIIVTTVILTTVFIGCESNKKNEVEAEVKTEATHEHDNASLALNNAWLEDIKLDQGKKWIANIETTQGVDKIAELLENSSPNTVEEYHQLASEISDLNNYVIKECTMTGPSHDNLHVFLHPLLEKTEALSKVESTDRAEVITASIKINIEEYYNFFK